MNHRASDIDELMQSHDVCCVLNSVTTVVTIIIFSVYNSVVFGVFFVCVLSTSFLTKEITYDCIISVYQVGYISFIVRLE